MQEMEGCGNCLQSPQGIAKQLERIKKQAADYVKEHRISTAIYRDGFEFRFAELPVALGGNYPIAEVLSFDPQAPSS